MRSSYIKEDVELLLKDITGMVELVAAIPTGRKIEAGGLHPLTQAEPSIAYTQVHRSIQHNVR